MASSSIAASGSADARSFSLAFARCCFMIFASMPTSSGGIGGPTAPQPTGKIDTTQKLIIILSRDNGRGQPFMVFAFSCSRLLALSATSSSTY